MQVPVSISTAGKNHDRFGNCTQVLIWPRYYQGGLTGESCEKKRFLTASLRSVQKQGILLL